MTMTLVGHTMRCVRVPFVTISLYAANLSCLLFAPLALWLFATSLLAVLFMWATAWWTIYLRGLEVFTNVMPFILALRDIFMIFCAGFRLWKRRNLRTGAGRHLTRSRCFLPRVGACMWMLLFLTLVTCVRSGPVAHTSLVHMADLRLDELGADYFRTVVDRPATYAQLERAALTRAEALGSLGMGFESDMGFTLKFDDFKPFCTLRDEQRWKRAINHVSFTALWQLSVASPSVTYTDMLGILVASLLKLQMDPGYQTSIWIRSVASYFCSLLYIPC